jgi:LmbE family N-acetylglucosaminyl deacetylase
MKLLFSPHDDDAPLFASATCVREKPIIVVVTDSFIQPLRGDAGCTAEIRAAENEAACNLLGCQVIRLGIADNLLIHIFEDVFRNALWRFDRGTPVYLPALQGGNPQHDLVSRVGCEYFKHTVFYATYAKGQHFTPLGEAVIPTEEERALKEKALACYTSQLNLAATRPHFEAVREKAEYLYKETHTYET